METQNIKIKCPKCQKEFNVRKPGAPGLYKVVCTNPECANELKLMIRAREVKMGEGAQQPQQAATPNATAPKIPLVGKPEKTEKGVYLLKTPLRLGEKVAYTCPVCGKNVVMAPKMVGALAASCPECKTRTAFRVVDPSVKPATQEVPSAQTRRVTSLHSEVKEFKVELVWGGLLHHKKAVLKEGINWVGRNEPSNPSDIMIDDPTMSAHSFSIERDSQQGTCKLFVQHATNPVSVNGVECKENCSVYLKFNDRIQAGKTILVVAKSK